MSDDRVAGYKTHPAADVFPLMTGEAFADLVADIRAKGLMQPIVMVSDRILDGRNRARACAEIGVEPRFVQYEGDDPVGYVVSLNLARRHLGESQRGMVARRIANLSFGANQHRAEGPPIGGPSVSIAKAAEMLNVGTTTIHRAGVVQLKGIPEVVAMVDAGEMALGAAEPLAKLPEETQREIVAKAEGNTRKVRDLVREAGGHAPKWSSDWARRQREDDACPSSEPEPEEDETAVTSRDPDVAALDAKIIEAYRGDGKRSPKMTAQIVGVTTSRVHGALSRAGLNTAARAAKDPLRDLVGSMKATAASWAELVNVAPWQTASADQRAELVEAINKALSKGRALVRAIESFGGEV